MNSGNLEGFRVQGGMVTIMGNGMDASATDYTDIIARAVQINAGIWANQLKVVTGTSQVCIDQTTNDPSVSGTTAGSRMQALAAGTAALTGKNGYDAIQAGQGITIDGKAGQIATGKPIPDGTTPSRDATAADKAGGSDVNWSNTRVEACNQISLQSGALRQAQDGSGDLNIKDAVASGVQGGRECFALSFGTADRAGIWHRR